MMPCSPGSGPQTTSRALSVDFACRIGTSVAARRALQLIMVSSTATNPSHRTQHTNREIQRASPYCDIPPKSSTSFRKEPVNLTRALASMEHSTEVAYIGKDRSGMGTEMLRQGMRESAGAGVRKASTCFVGAPILYGSGKHKC